MKYLFSALVALTLSLTAAPVFANDAVISGINDIRKSKGLAPVVKNAKLMSIAKGHANDMVKRNYYSHRGKNGSTPGKRARRAGYRYCVIAENIGKGQRSSGQIVADWRKSPGHYKNIINRKVREVGAANAGDIWVLVVAATKC